MSSLREKLRVLEELQQIDLDAHAMRQGLDAIPAERAKLEARVKAARKAYDDQKARLEANEREQRQVDTLLGMDRDKVKKWEGRLGEIKTPREYAAMSREIDIAKKSNETQSEQAKLLSAAAIEIKMALEDQRRGAGRGRGRRPGRRREARQGGRRGRGQAGRAGGAAGHRGHAGRRRAARASTRTSGSGGPAWPWPR